MRMCLLSKEKILLLSRRRSRASRVNKKEAKNRKAETAKMQVQILMTNMTTLRPLDWREKNSERKETSSY